MNWRKLKPSELRDGLYVQVKSDISTIYKLILIDDCFFYTVENSDWKISSALVLDNWYETDKTKEYNRGNKLNYLLDEGI